MEGRDPDSYPCQVTLSASSTFRATNRARFCFKLWLQGILLHWSGLWLRINRHCIRWRQRFNFLKVGATLDHVLKTAVAMVKVTVIDTGTQAI